MESAEAKEELAMKEEEEILAKNKDVSLLLQHSKLKKLAEARQVYSQSPKEASFRNDIKTKKPGYTLS